MALATLKPRLTSASLTRTPVLQAKAGSTERERGRAWMAKRQRVALAHDFKCAGCGRVWVPREDHIDHKVGLEQGGSNDESNLQPLCKTCHDSKSAGEAGRRSGKTW